MSVYFLSLGRQGTLHHRLRRPREDDPRVLMPSTLPRQQASGALGLHARIPLRAVIPRVAATQQVGCDCPYHIAPHAAPSSSPTLAAVAAHRFHHNRSRASRGDTPADGGRGACGCKAEPIEQLAGLGRTHLFRGPDPEKKSSRCDQKYASDAPFGRCCAAAGRAESAAAQVRRRSPGSGREPFGSRAAALQSRRDA